MDITKLEDITPEDSVVPVYRSITPKELVEQNNAWVAGAYQREYDAVTVARQQGYQSTSDPIFMQYQRGEATEQEWLDAVQAVKDANPYPVKEAN